MASGTNVLPDDPLINTLLREFKELNIRGQGPELPRDAAVKLIEEALAEGTVERRMDQYDVKPGESVYEIADDKGFSNRIAAFYQRCALSKQYKPVDPSTTQGGHGRMTRAETQRLGLQLVANDLTGGVDTVDPRLDQGTTTTAGSGRLIQRVDRRAQVYSRCYRQVHQPCLSKARQG